MSGLNGRRVVNTRAPHQSADLDNLLRAHGATPLAYPCIEIAPPENLDALDDALRAAASGGFDWLVLTSTNTVAALEGRLRAIGLPYAALAALKVAAVGPATARAAEIRLGVEVSLIPEAFVADALAEAFGALTPDPYAASLRSTTAEQKDARPAPPSGRGEEKRAREGLRILLPQSALADATLAEQLCASGMKVTTVTAYRMVTGIGGVALGDLLARGEIDAVTFTSGSTVTNCLRRLQAEGDRSLPPSVVVACIGPRTAAAAQESGLRVRVMPPEHTLEALVAALDDYFSTQSTGEL